MRARASFCQPGHRILTYTVSLAGATGVVAAVHLGVIVAGLGEHADPFGADLVGPFHGRRRRGRPAVRPCPPKAVPLRGNRIVYGEREAPDAVLRAFGSRLSAPSPWMELLLQVAESLRKTLALTSAEVWTGSGGHLQRTVSVPTPRLPP